MDLFKVYQWLVHWVWRHSLEKGVILLTMQRRMTEDLYIVHGLFLLARVSFDIGSSGG